MVPSQRGMVVTQAGSMATFKLVFRARVLRLASSKEWQSVVSKREPCRNLKCFWKSCRVAAMEIESRGLGLSLGSIALCPDS